MLSAASSSAEESFGEKWFRGGGGSRSKWSRGKCSGEAEKASGEEIGEGEVLVVPNGAGRRRWPN